MVYRAQACLKKKKKLNAPSRYKTINVQVKVRCISKVVMYKYSKISIKTLLIMTWGQGK